MKCATWPCQNEARPNRRQCAPCAARVNESHRSWRAKKKLAGICVDCREPAVAGRGGYCGKHADIHVAATQAAREGRRAAPSGQAMPQ